MGWIHDQGGCRTEIRKLETRRMLETAMAYHKVGEKRDASEYIDLVEVGRLYQISGQEGIGERGKGGGISAALLNTDYQIQNIK